MRFKKILSPVDFSPASDEAMRAAVQLANEHDAELVLAHAWHLPPFTFGTEPYEAAPMLLQQIADDAQRGLDEAVRAATRLGAKRVTATLRAGVPAAQLTELLEAEPFDLVVMGTHGRTGMKRILLGSVAEKLVRHAPCSVLVVRPNRPLGPFDDLLCPVDFSESTAIATGLAADLVRPGGTGITLLHALELPVAVRGENFPPDFLRDLDRESARGLDTLVAKLRAASGVPVVARTRIGAPASQILAVLDEDPRFDLVIVGSHGRTGLRRAILGSVAEKIVRHAPCPVLVARATSGAAPA